MKLRNTVQCSGSKVKPAGGDENDDHHPAGFFLLVFNILFYINYAVQDDSTIKKIISVKVSGNFFDGLLFFTLFQAPIASSGSINGSPVMDVHYANKANHERNRYMLSRECVCIPSERYVNCFVVSRRSKRYLTLSAGQTLSFPPADNMIGI